MAQKHDCNQADRILTLELKETQMSKYIEEIKKTSIDTQNTVKDINDTLKAFILTAPQKYADKKEMEDFKSGINSKIAYIT